MMSVSQPVSSQTDMSAVLLLVLTSSLGPVTAAQSGPPLLGQNPCVSKQSCSECLQTPTCAWCSQPGYAASDGSLLPRCNQEEFYLLSSR